MKIHSFFRWDLFSSRFSSMSSPAFQNNDQCASSIVTLEPQLMELTLLKHQRFNQKAFVNLGLIFVMFYLISSIRKTEHRDDIWCQRLCLTPSLPYISVNSATNLAFLFLTVKQGCFSLQHLWIIQNGDPSEVMCALRSCLSYPRPLIMFYGNMSTR